MIIKVVEDIIGCPVAGCFFNFSQCLKRKMEKRGLKGGYAHNSRFQFFMKASVGLEAGLEYLRNDSEFQFENTKIQNFKHKLLNYIDQY